MDLQTSAMRSQACLSVRRFVPWWILELKTQAKACDPSGTVIVPNLLPDDVVQRKRTPFYDLKQFVLDRTALVETGFFTVSLDFCTRTRFCLSSSYPLYDFVIIFCRSK